MNIIEMQVREARGVFRLALESIEESQVWQSVNTIDIPQTPPFPDMPEIAGQKTLSLARKISMNHDKQTRIEEILSACDSLVIFDLKIRAARFLTFLNSSKEPVVWPTEPKDVWIHIAKAKLPKLPGHP